MRVHPRDITAAFGGSSACRESAPRKLPEPTRAANDAVDRHRAPHGSEVEQMTGDLTTDSTARRHSQEMRPNARHPWA